ncbi:MAG: glycosyltransferase family 39 protein [Bacteroidota bacterium]
MMLVFPILLSCLLGYLTCLFIFEERTLSDSRFLINLSFPIGLGISSLIFISFNLLHFHYLLILLIEIGLTALLLVKLKKVKRSFFKFEHFSLNKLILNPVLLFTTVIYLYSWLMDAGIFFFDTVKEPNGLWDAWAMWNMKAKVISQAPYNWPDLFGQMNMDSFHIDYPLLQTGFIARSWLLMGNESTYIPAIVAFIFAFCTIGLLYSSITFFTTKTEGLIAGLILLCTPFFMIMGDSQYADNTVGFFYLATIVLLTFAQSHTSLKPRLLILAGITAGLSAWSKNEGILFITCLIISQFTRLFFKNFRELAAELKYLFLGMLPVLIVVAYHKLAIAPTNDIIQAQGATTWAKLTDYSRYETVLNWYIAQFGTFGKWVLNPWWLFLIGILANGLSFNKNNGVISNSILLIIMLAGFFFIYIITPLDLTFHLSSSIHRLFFQLFPSFIFVYFIALKRKLPIKQFS